MKKKILFTTFDLSVGGIESSLINLVNNIDYDKYDVTVLLQLKRGELLKYVNNNVKVLDYNLSTMKFSLLRKFINLIKIILVFIKNYRKYDFSACYGTGYPVSAKLAYFSSKNNAIWMHTNIIQFIKNGYQVKTLFKKDVIGKVKVFLKRIWFRKFKRYFFVSENAIDAYLSIYPTDKEKTILCHNFVDYKKIIEKSNVEVDDMYKKDSCVFINISRHTEYDKRLSRIINAVEKLKNDYKFKLIMIGDGLENSYYKELVKEKKLNKFIKFYGLKSNPFPYLKEADALVMSSAFEGFPTTFTEAMTLNIPIITTEVSDANSIIKNKYGIVVENNDNSIYYGMKKFLDEGFNIKNKFNPKKYNDDSLNKIYNEIEKRK